MDIKAKGLGRDDDQLNEPLQTRTLVQLYTEEPSRVTAGSTLIVATWLMALVTNIMAICIVMSAIALIGCTDGLRSAMQRSAVEDGDLFT